MKKLLLVLAAASVHSLAVAQQKQVPQPGQVKPDSATVAAQLKQQEIQRKQQELAQQKMTLDTATLRKHYAHPTTPVQKADSVQYEQYLVGRRQIEAQKAQEDYQKKLIEHPFKDQMNAAGGSGVVPQREATDKGKRKTKYRKSKP